MNSVEDIIRRQQNHSDALAALTSALTTLTQMVGKLDQNQTEMRQQIRDLQSALNQTPPPEPTTPTH